MTHVELKNVSYSYSDQRNLGGGIHDVSITSRAGEIIAVVGASGSGKSTLLKVIAGFLQPQSGEIFINGELVASNKINLPPKARSIGLVFQNHALLPHKSVRANVEFGYSKKHDNQQVDDILRELRIDQLADKYPHEISGGQSQRVSLARAIAARSGLFLMDEPFSSIDSVFRRELRNDMLRFLRQKERTTILVTHDAEEALELADQIVVLDEGRVLQIGSPKDVYFEPSHVMVAELFGEVNHIKGRAFVKALTGKDNDEALIRPELIEISDEGAIRGHIIHLAYRGSYQLVSIIVDGHHCLKAHALPIKGDLQLGQSVGIALKN